MSIDARYEIWGARASRVLVLASRQHELSIALRLLRGSGLAGTASEVYRGGTPRPARETRALPGNLLRHFLLP